MRHCQGLFFPQSIPIEPNTRTHDEQQKVRFYRRKLSDSFLVTPCSKFWKAIIRNMEYQQDTFQTDQIYQAQ